MELQLIKEFKNIVGKLRRPQLIEAAYSVFNESEFSNEIIFIPDGFSKVRAVELCNILYLRMLKNKIEINFKNGSSFNYMSMSMDLLEHLEGINQNFRFINNEVMVNLQQVKVFDSYYRRVYFSNTNREIYAEATKAALDKIVRPAIGKDKDIVGQVIDVAVEYSPKSNRRANI